MRGRLNHERFSRTIRKNARPTLVFAMIAKPALISWFGGVSRTTTCGASSKARIPRRLTSTQLGANFSHLSAPLDAPGRSPRASSTNLGRLDRPRSTHFDRLGRLEEPQATHFTRLRRFDRPCTLARTTCQGPIDLLCSTWLHRSGHVATA